MTLNVTGNLPRYLLDQRMTYEWFEAVLLLIQRDPQNDPQNVMLVQASENVSSECKTWLTALKLTRLPVYRLEYNRKRREDSADKFRSLVRNSLKGKVKYAKTKELMGCGTLQVQHHLEKQFADYMTWANNTLKGWHIDHIVPIRAFDLDNIVEQHACFWYKNLQPLWAKDNMKKKDKYKEEDKQALIKEWIFYNV